MSESRILSLTELKIRLARCEFRIHDARVLRESVVRNPSGSQAVVDVVSYLDNRIASEKEQLNRTQRAIEEYESSQSSYIGVLFIDGKRV